MIALVLVVVRFFRALRIGLVEPEFRALAISVAVVLAVGTVFYSLEEGWSLLDALYFSVVTLTTIGYGDLYPTTALSKLFTIVYVVLGVGLITTFVALVARRSVEQRRQRSDGTRQDGSAGTADDADGRRG